MSTSLPDYLSPAQRQRLDWVYRKLRVDMVSVYWWHVGADWVMKSRRLHDDFFFAPMSQRLEARVGEEKGLVLPGQCMFVCEGEEHESRMPEGSIELRVVSVHANLYPEWGGSIRQLVGGAIKRLPDLAGDEARLARVAHTMEADPGLGRAMGEAMIRDWLAFWALEEAAGEGTEARGQGRLQKGAKAMGDVRVEQALTMIHTHYDQALSVGQLAREVRLKEVQFRKLFKAVQGESPKAYLAGYRLAQAARQLRLGTGSVKEVAHATGFTDVHYFHLAFKRRFGCTPLAYRGQGVGVV
jgi:AraC-like DNA-binding protein